MHTKSSPRSSMSVKSSDTCAVIKEQDQTCAHLGIIKVRKTSIENFVNPAVLPEPDSNFLSHRKISTHDSEEVSLYNRDPKYCSESFHELIRRVKKPHQEEIIKKLKDVSNEELEKLNILCYTPHKILKSNFFLSPKLPFVALEAYRTGKISLYEFSTFVSVHASYIEDLDDYRKSSIQFTPLFNKKRKAIKKSWCCIQASILKSNEKKKVLALMR